MSGYGSYFVSSDPIQNIFDSSIRIKNGRLIMHFSRNLVTNDASRDVALDKTAYIFFAVGPFDKYLVLNYHTYRMVSSVPITFTNCLSNYLNSVLI